MGQIISTLKRHGLCREVYYKEMYLPKAEVDGEHTACFVPSCTVDFLLQFVLQQSALFRPCESDTQVAAKAKWHSPSPFKKPIGRINNSRDKTENVWKARVYTVPDYE